MTTNVVTFVGGACSLLGAVLYVWRRVRLTRVARDRVLEAATREGASERAVPSTTQTALRRHRLVPWAAAALFAFGVWMWLPVGGLFVVTFGLITALLGSQLEGFVAARRATRMEVQLADAIDLMVGALSAGAGITGALENAARETPRPLRPQLEEVLGRIRFGDEPRSAFSALAERVPIETFLLFASTLSAQWEVGGSLASTLAATGRTIRDRIELSRRVRSNVIQSQFSTVMILAITYFIALVMWRTNPEQMAEFLETSLGRASVAGSVLLQAAGIVWMSAISRPRF